MKKILIITGEVSGDMHASFLIKEAKRKDPELKFYAIAGKNSKQAGAEILLPMESLTAMGFIAPILKIFHFKRIIRFLKSWMKKNKPKAIILIDFPGFNLQIALRAKRIGIPVIYYILPQIWAWGGWRVNQIKKYVDLALVILPFVPEYLQLYNIKSYYVGHPIVDHIKNYKLKNINLPIDKKIIGVFPGSRESEIKRHLPMMLDISKEISDKYEDVVFVYACDEKYLVRKNDLNNVFFINDRSYEIMNLSSFLIVASGTVTLEGAFFEKPMVVVYKIDEITYFIAKILAKVKYISLVNLIGKEEIIPELIQQNAEKDKIIKIVERLLFDKVYYKNIVKKLQKVKKKINVDGASAKAAEYFIKYINECKRKN